jgi:hypothetical protein
MPKRKIRKKHDLSTLNPNITPGIADISEVGRDKRRKFIVHTIDEFYVVLNYIQTNHTYIKMYVKDVLIIPVIDNLLRDAEIETKKKRVLKGFCYRIKSNAPPEDEDIDIISEIYDNM